MSKATSSFRFLARNFSHRISVLLFHCCVMLPFKGKRTRRKCQRITLYNRGFTAFLLRKDEAKTKWNGIINLLFGILIDKAREDFTHCSHFSEPRTVKYPHFLSTKTPSKNYMLLNSIKHTCDGRKVSTDRNRTMCRLRQK